MKRLAAIVLFVLAFAGVARADDKVLNLFAWSEYVPQEVIDGFTKETGIKVNYDTYASNEELISKLRAGGARYDLIQPSEYTCEALIKAGKLEPIDLAKIPNFKNLLPEYTNMAFDPGNKFTIPYMTGSVGICVNTEKITEPIHGFKDVFQPKYAGRIIVVNDSREMASWALATLGIGPNDMSAENLAKAKPILAGWMKLIKKYDSDSPKTDLLAGNVDIGVVWSGEAALCWKENHHFAYVLPAEGAHLFIDNLAIPKGAANAAGAMRFMDYILRPEVSKIISDKFPYTNPNGEARKLLSKDQLDNPASYPKNPPKLDIFHDIGRQASGVEEMVTDLKNGS
jgi:spermidine/putrescine transport system substrate-binding protein